jgi:hydroxymethylbilane synthase
VPARWERGADSWFLGMTSQPVIRFGTRGSALARAQTDLVLARLATIHPEVRAETIVIQTEGDRDKTSSLTVIGGRGVFTTALQDALRRGEIDAAVHSAKDLPTESPADLRIAAFLERTDARDVFVSKHRRPLSDLDLDPVIGTSSRRRAMQVLKLRPDAQIVDLRGNIDTRLKKAFETDLDGIVLAAAGFERMGWSDQITEYLPLEIVVPSPGQGALAVEIRAKDFGSALVISDLDDPEVSLAVKTERAFLRGMGGGCTSPVGAHATIDGDQIRLLAMIGTVDGSRIEWIDERFPITEGEISAESLSSQLLAQIELPSTLTGKRILVTTGNVGDRLATGLQARGALTIVAPMTRIEFIDIPSIGTAINEFGEEPFDWIVFTSQNAVDGFLSCPEGSTLVEEASIAAVGAATTHKLRKHGIDVALQPAKFSGAALGAEMRKHDLKGKRILFPHGDLARQALPDSLREAGAIVETLLVYRTVSVNTIKALVLEQLSAGEFDALVFCSPSAVHSFVGLMGSRLEGLQGLTIASIGPTTAEAARQVGLAVQVEAEVSTIVGLIHQLERFYDKEADRVELVGAERSGEGGPVG